MGNPLPPRTKGRRPTSKNCSCFLVVALFWAAIRIMRPHIPGGSADAALQKPGPAAAALGAGRGENQALGCVSQAEHSTSVLARRQGRVFSRGKGPFLTQGSESQCWTDFLLQHAKKTAMGKTKAGKMFLALAGTMQLHSKCLKQWVGDSRASHLPPGLPSAEEPPPLPGSPATVDDTCSGQQ